MSGDVIESLIRVGERENIDMALHFGAKPEHLAYHLDKKEDKLEHREECLVRIPWPVNRSSNPKPNLLFDSPQYWFKTEAKRKLAKGLHERWAALCPKHKAVKAVTSFFDEEPQTLDIPKKLAKLDVVFYFKGKPVCEIPELWDGIDKTLRGEHTYVTYPSRYDGRDQCVVDMHGKLAFSKLDNPQSLLSYNKDVTQCLHIAHEQRMLHAGMSYEVMRLYVGGAEWLRVHRRLSVPSISTGGGLNYCGWTEEPHRIEKVVKVILRGNKDMTREEWLLWVVEHLDNDHDLFVDKTRYNVLSLWCKARIAIRGFHVMTVAELAQRLVTYLNDFSYTRGEVHKRALVTPWSVLQQLQYGNDPSLSVVERFYDAIFLGAMYPRELLPAVLSRYAERVSAEQSHVLADATIHAFMKRPTEKIKNMQNVHPDTSNNPLFLIGRLFAVLEARNFDAKDKGDKRVTITHHFKRAWDDPAKVFPWLLALSERHAEKLEKRKHRSYRGKVNELFAATTEALSRQSVPAWPGRTTPEQKMLFVQGREYQRKIEWDERTARIEAAASKAAV